MFALLLGACATHQPAPVTSREALSPAAGPPTLHRVRPGDTLYSIAWRAGTDYHNLAQWNGIRPPYTIYPGQRLRLTPPPRSDSQPKRSPIRTSGKKRSPSPAAQKPATPHRPPARTSRAPTPREKSTGSGGFGGWQWPTEGRVVERFSKRDTTRNGLKISGRLGQSVRAAAPGKIVYSGNGLRGYGRLIIIKHDKNYLSAYGHNRKILVREGEQVQRGERIAEMGRLSDGRPGLHFEIRRGGTPVDPVALLPAQRQ